MAGAPHPSPAWRKKDRRENSVPTTQMVQGGVGGEGSPGQDLRALSERWRLLQAGESPCHRPGTAAPPCQLSGASGGGRAPWKAHCPVRHHLWPHYLLGGLWLACPVLLQAAGPSHLSIHLRNLQALTGLASPVASVLWKPHLKSTGEPALPSQGSELAGGRSSQREPPSGASRTRPALHTHLMFRAST